ncbi:MAG: lamin tail domain-containing protein [Planctomycetes bacterium]|nr:lamin tail domain-containing protein [Planctomycetota bacterium]
MSRSRGHRHFSPTSERLEPRQMLSANVLINEIHYDPDVKTQLVEFVELYNAGDESAELTGWRISDGVQFEFPAGASIPAGGYLVIAQDPLAFNAKFGRTAFGPYLGKLSSRGEKVEISDASNVRQDIVDYKLGFPWPTVGDRISRFGDGHSIQLIHPSLDNDLGGSWRSAAPTPGARNNGVFNSSAAPQMRQVDHNPNQPASGESVTITVKVTDPDGVASVVLEYQTVDPGNYIRLTDAAYRTSWTSLVMRDDGTGGDELAGDDTFTATLPADLQTHRRLVRYRITSEDTLGNSITGPYDDDPQPNFAYFVYDGVPDWTAADRPGVTDPETFGSDVMNQLPVYHLISNNADVQNSQYVSSFKQTRFWGTIVYDGVVYDHVNYRVRGEASTYVSGKNKWRIFFNRGHRFRAVDDFGVPNKEAWSTINFSALASPWLAVNRGMAGLDEGIAFAAYELAGIPTPNTSYFQFRVIDNAAEAPTNQYGGDMWGLYMTIEHLNDAFIDEHDLPDGNIYKMQGGPEKKNQGATQTTSNSDVNAFRSASSTFQTVQWWRDNTDLEALYTFKALNRAMNNADLRDNFNFLWYHRSDDDRWVPIPWDMDMLFPETTHIWPATIVAVENVVNQHPELRIEFQARARELRDLLFNDQFEQLVDQFVEVVAPADMDLTMADVDRFMWNNHPRAAGGHRGAFYDSPRRESRLGGPDYTRTLVTEDMAGMGQFIKDTVKAGGYNGIRFNALFADTSIPRQPTVSYIGAEEFPLNGLRFQTSSFSDPQGNGTFAAMEWRIGEVTDPSAADFDSTKRPKYEIEADWESGEITVFDNAISIPAENLDVGDTYRVRVRMKDSSGRWSHWSEPVQFVAGTPTASPLVEGLRITEVHYNPAGPVEENDQFEFIELQNIGQRAVDLSGVALKDGVRFQFAGSSITSLAPGAFVLVVRNQAAFESRYEVGLPIAGEYDGKLQNDGERIELVDVAEGTLQKFKYKDGWYDLTDGEGFSLTRVDLGDAAADASLSDRASWRPSSDFGGSPGEIDTFSVPAPGAIVVNEVLAHSDTADGDWIELLNTTNAPIDMSGWFLSNEKITPLKYEVPSGTIIPAGGFVIFTQSMHFGESFALSDLGDEVIVQAAQGGVMLGFRAREDFGASENGRTLGRTIKSTGGKDFVAMENATFGATNSGPLVGPVVIHEVMYNPSRDDDSDGGSEFVELINISGAAVSLEGWHFEAIRYTFGPEAVIEPGGLVVVVPLDPAEFRATHNVPDEARLFGPYLGALSNGGESLRLNKPGEPDGEFIPSIMVDRVSYDDKAPWPVEADGTGAALQRIVPEAYGNEPENWGVTLPGGTPGDFLILPMVNEVLVSASAWSSAMLDGLSAAGLGEGGFSIPAGARQLQNIAWTGIDQISLRFSEHVDVTSADLQVAGAGVHDYRIVDFEYDRPTLTATWTLDRPARADKLLIELSDDVRDQSGLPPDGNWTDTFSVFPSGNGAIDGSGDAFQFRINIIAGDVTDDGRVDRADLVDLIHAIGDRSATADSLRRDLTGDGRIDLSDLRSALLRMGSGLPSGEPEPPGSATPQAAVDVFFARAGAASPGRFLLTDPIEGISVSDVSVRAQRKHVGSPSLGHLIDAIDRLGRRDHATLRRANRISGLSSHDMSLRRLQAVAVDHALAEESTTEGASTLRRRARHLARR